MGISEKLSAKSALNSVGYRILPSLVALGFFASPFCLASSEPDNARPTGGGAADLLNMTKTPPELSGDSKEPNSRFIVGCTNSEGLTLQSGDIGYEKCINEAQGKSKNSGNANVTFVPSKSRKTP